MSSEEISLQSGLNVFQDDPLRAAFSCGPTRPGPKTRELSSFIDEKMFPFPSSQGADEYRGGNLYGGSERRDPPGEPRNWGSGSGSHSGEESDEDEDDDDDEGEEEDDGDGDENNIEVVVDVNGHSGNDKSNTGSVGVHCSAGNLNSDKVANGNGKLHPSFGGASREVVMKESVTMVQTSGDSSYQNEVTVAQRNGDMYYVQYLHGVDGSGCVGAGQKDVIAENASSCGISGRKESSFSSESSDSLRAILSDPFTGALMDDAMILPCGHSFTSAGLEHVLRMKACYTCSLSVSEDSVAPNLSLRAAVQAFRREEEMQIYRSSKRRRERYEQDKAGQSDPNLMDYSRGRGVQFPFAVMDRVVIKGNKRTPQRFVGREAVVTTQCLNGWYVVKTLDNAESVKLQYRSLAKLPDNPSSKVMSGKMGPNWQ